MVLNIFATLFVVGIAFMHSLFGLYSGLVNCFCSVAALAVAFGFWEPLNNLATGTLHLHSGYTEPFALVVPFVITLLVLRVAADNLLRGNVHIPRYVDWAGGAVCGFVNAQIAVGVMVLGFLLLPWGGRVMMYQRYERDPDNQIDPQTDRVVFHRNTLWLRSDEFAVGLFNLLSRGSLKGPTTFGSVYPSYADWVFYSGNQIQPEALVSPVRDERIDGFQKGISVEAWWFPKAPLPADMLRYRKLPPSTENPTPPYAAAAYNVAPGNRLLGVRLALGDAAADREKDSAAHRFRPTMIRVVGDLKRADGSTEPRQYIPAIIGGADASIGDNLRIVDMDTNFSGGSQMRIDAFFDVDEAFEPRFVEYRRHARAALAAAQRKEAAPAGRLSATGKATGPTADRPSGIARFIDTVVRGNSGDTDRLPVKMAASKLSISLDVEIRNNQFVSGRVQGMLSALSDDRPDPIEKFQVPEGARIFQIQVHTRKMESLLGQVINFAAAVTNQYKAVDREGNTHDLAGYYAITSRDDDKFIELFFTPAPADTGYNGLLDFKDSDVRRELRQQEDAVLGLIFVLPPGKCIVSIQSQGGKVEFGEEMCVGG